MISGYFIKHPSETKSYNIDLAPDIPSGDSLNGCTVTIGNSLGEDITALTEVTTTVTINTDSIDIAFVGGIHGENYFITVIVTLGTSTTTPVRMVEMRVRASEV